MSFVLQITFDQTAVLFLEHPVDLFCYNSKTVPQNERKNDNVHATSRLGNLNRHLLREVPMSLRLDCGNAEVIPFISNSRTLVIFVSFIRRCFVQIHISKLVDRTSTPIVTVYERHRAPNLVVSVYQLLDQYLYYHTLFAKYRMIF